MTFNWIRDTQIEPLHDHILNDVRTILQMKLKNGRCSPLLESELAWCIINRAAQAHRVYETIHRLENGRPPSSTRRAEKLKYGLLDGVYHQHIIQPSDIIHNISAELATSKRLDRFFRRHAGKFMEDVAGELVHEIVSNTYEQRCRSGKMTGGLWLIFQQETGINTYLALAPHSPPRRSPEYAAWEKRLAARVEESRRHMG